MYIDDVEEEWERRNEGGTDIDKANIFCLKFADDIAAVADSREGLQYMIKEKYSRVNELEVNASKTKVMIFRNGGKRGKGDRWVYTGRELVFRVMVYDKK